MDECLLLTLTPECPVSYLVETLHEGLGVNNIHPSKFNPQYNMIPRALVQNCHNYAYDKQIQVWIEGNHSLRCQVNT